MVEFKEWPKIPRGSGETITITEKIDGTNACIIVNLDADGINRVIGVQSRSRLIYPGNDNYGFAAYVEANKEELASKLGEGYHYGEWAGEGIQKNHHNIVGKKLFLFNSDRWRDGRQERPAGVECVPVLYDGLIENENGNAIDIAMTNLWATAKDQGYHPEGVIVYYHKTRRYENIRLKTQMESGPMQIKIYGRPNCTWCDAAINLLNRKGVAFEYFNLFDLPFNEKQDVVGQSGMKTVPIVKVGDVFIGGYDQLEAYINGKETGV